MLKAICELEGITPVRFNRHITQIKDGNETNDDFEKRIWQERGEYDEKDHLFLNRLRFKASIALGAKWLNMKIPGEGGAKYNKLFIGSMIVTNHIPLKVHRGDVRGIWLFTAPKKGHGSRWVCFPEVEEWAGNLEVHIHDEKITPDIFQQAVDYAGLNIGIGAWRPENGGENGRFECLKYHFETVGKK